MRRIGMVFLVALAVGLGLWQLSKSRSVQLFGDMIARVETDVPLVALTFDDGPTGWTETVLAVLAEREVRASFFVTGREAEANAPALRAIVAAGHEVGNHSWSHRRMVLMAPSTVRDELLRTDAAIRAAGYEGPIHVRPPHGKRLVVLPWVLARQERLTVMWDVAPDRDPAASAAQIARTVLERVRPGSIILLHPMYESRTATREALPAIIDGLRALGYEFPTVSQLRMARKT